MNMKGPTVEKSWKIKKEVSKKIKHNKIKLKRERKYHKQWQSPRKRKRVPVHQSVSTHPENGLNWSTGCGSRIKTFLPEIMYMNSMTAMITHAPKERFVLPFIFTILFEFDFFGERVFKI